MPIKKTDRMEFLSDLGKKAGSGILGLGLLSSLTGSSSDCRSTPIQELGPYPAMKFRNNSEHDVDLTHVNGSNTAASGEIITIFGKVTDENCNPVKSAIVEIWSADHYGKYHHEFDSQGIHDPNFQGWGQVFTNKDGQYSFKTIIPGQYASRTRHIHFKISRRGYHELVTQLYFEVEELNSTDGVLNILTHEEQMEVIRPITNDRDQSKVEFNIRIESVKKGELPEKVLKEYAGTYELEFKDTILDKFIQRVVGEKYDKLNLIIDHSASQIYMNLPYTPRTEIIWAQKDEFQAWSFYNSYFRFKRNSSGKIESLELHYGGDENIIKGLKL
ncbi:hypothetical protein BH10BAC5_BH10BAC5_08660 [soil metagenome]